MPEIIELKIASDFVLTKSDLTFSKVEFSKVTKNPTNIIPNGFGNFKIKSTTRGKEMKLLLNNGKDEISLIFQFGMSGNWKWVNENVLDKEKHHHFRLHTNNKVLTFWDPRRFGGWRIGDWSKERGPDPIKEFDLFKQKLDLNGKWKSKPIYEVMLDQSIFNGIGNYLRSEILSRADVNPFLTWNSLNDKERNSIIDLCKLIPLEVEELGGGQLRDWDNPEGIDSNKFNQWLKCYSKEKSILDKNGRRFWFDNKWFGYIPKNN